MKRRAFLAGAGAAGVGLGGMVEAEAQAQAGGQARPYYEFRFHRMTQGDRPRRLHEFFRQHVLPLIQKHKLGPAGFFDVALGPDTPAVVSMLTFSSLAEREEIGPRVMTDPDFQKALAELESAAEPPIIGIDSFLIRATPYSPPVAAAAAEQKPRLLELRIYHSPTQRQLAALHERFGGPEIKIFHRTGVHPVLYGDMVIGRDMPNLVYLTPFENLAAREKAWAAFGADPEWQKVREESIKKSGQIVSNVSVIMLRAAPYSPIR